MGEKCTWQIKSPMRVRNAEVIAFVATGYLSRAIRYLKYLQNINYECTKFLKCERSEQNTHPNPPTPKKIVQKGKTQPPGTHKHTHLPPQPETVIK